MTESLRKISAIGQLLICAERPRSAILPIPFKLDGELDSMLASGSFLDELSKVIFPFPMMK